MKALHRATFALILSICSVPGTVSAITLGDALDNTNLLWTTSVSNALERPWFAEQNANPHDGVDGAVSGNKSAHGTSSWLQTTVVGPGTLSYWFKVSSEETLVILDEIFYFDYLDVEINGSIVDQTAGPCGGWQFRAFYLPEGTNTVRWTYFKDSTTTDSCGVDQARLDQVRFDPSPFTVGEALGTCGYEWISGSTNATPWIGQTNVTFDGKSAESGFTDLNNESWLSVAVAGVSNVSFQWRVSSRTNADYLEFYTNAYVHNPASPPANFATRISGDVTSWRFNSFKISTNDTTLTWRYVKSAQTPVGQNRGWLDQVKFSPDTVRTPYVLSNGVRLQDGRFQFTLTGQSNCPCRIEASTNLVNWSTVTDVFPAASSTTVQDAGAAGQSKRFYRGKSL